LYPVSGAKLFIGGTADLPTEDLDLADFESVSPPISWVEISGWTQMGAIGDTAALISTDIIGSGRTIKQKGVANAGQMQNTFAILPGDAGQDDLREAAEGSDKDNRYFKIEWPDGDDSVSPVVEPSKRYFVGIVMNAVEQGGDANTILALSSTIEINSNIVPKAAA
jgi:hypothetical protein